MSISLLPSDLRDKENQEKEKVRLAMKEKKFKMHEPGEYLDDSEKINFSPTSPVNDLEIGLASEPKIENRGTFRIVKKQEKKIVPPIVPQQVKVETPPPIVPPKVKVEMPLPVVKKTENPSTFRMKIPNLIKMISGRNGKKIIQETSDQIDDVLSPPPISEYFHRDLKKVYEEKKEAEVNLIDNDYEYLVRKKFWNRLRGLLIIALIFLIMFSAVFIYLKTQKTNLVSEYNQVNQSIAQTEAEINTYGFEKMQAIALKDRALILKILLDQHIYWTKFLGLLEHSTISDVYYVNFVADSNGDIILSAKAKTYNNVAEQLLVFQEADFIEQVEINSATKTQLENVVSEIAEDVPVSQSYPIDFSVTIKLKQEALAQK